MEILDTFYYYRGADPMVLAAWTARCRNLGAIGLEVGQGITLAPGESVLVVKEGNVIRFKLLRENHIIDFPVEKFKV